MNKDLTIFEKTDLNYDEREFISLHNKIVEAGTFASMYVYEMAKLLHEMHESKKYIVAGFETFEDYTENVLNMKRSQAYKYINIALTFSNEFFHSSGQKLGITKLSLLSNLGEDGATEFIEHHDVEDMSVSELKAELDALKKSNNENLNKAFNYQQQVKELTKINADLEVKLNKPAEIKEIIKEVKIEDTSKLDDLRAQIEALNIEKTALLDKLEKAKNDKSKEKIKELTKALESAELKSSSLESTVDELNKKLNLASNENYNKFKILFEVLKTDFNNTIKFITSLDDKEFKDKCYLALNKLLEVINNE